MRIRKIGLLIICLYASVRIFMINEEMVWILSSVSTGLIIIASAGFRRQVRTRPAMRDAIRKTVFSIVLGLCFLPVVLRLPMSNAGSTWSEVGLLFLGPAASLCLLIAAFISTIFVIFGLLAEKPYGGL